MSSELLQARGEAMDISSELNSILEWDMYMSGMEWNVKAYGYMVVLIFIVCMKDSLYLSTLFT